jgi:hypothetical protein
MKELIKSIFRFIGGKDLLIFLTITLALYIIIEKTGLFRIESASLRQIFHSTPSKIISILFVLNALSGLCVVLFHKTIKSKIGYILFFIAIVMLSTGLWTSAFTRFEGKSKVIEGGSFTAFPTQYIQETLYMRQRSDMPQVGFTILEIKPELSDDKLKLKKVTTDVLYSSRTTGKVLNGELSSGWPLISDWTLLRITDFGYTVHYKLMDLQERELEKRDINMKLFPPGAEEFFDVMFLGYMFHVRLYPDYVDNDGKPGTLSAYPRNPVFILRVVRNKDIVFNDTLTTTEKLRFDNQVIAMPEVKMWVEVSLTRDLGLPVAASGIVLMLAGVTLMVRRKKQG